jgi:hypothetical protein
MRLFVYSSNHSDASRRLLFTMDAASIPHRLVQDLTELRSALSEPVADGVRTLLFHAQNIKELDSVGEIVGGLPECKLYLVLPDRSPETMKKAHSMCPRYFTYQDCSFADLAGIFAKLYTNYKREPEPQTGGFKMSILSHLGDVS